MIARALVGARTRVAVFAALVLAACTSDSSAPTATDGGRPRMTAVPAAVQISATVDTAIAGVLGGNAIVSVQVTDTTGRPLFNQTVTFLPDAGSGNVLRNGGAIATANTNANGDVVATWNFGGAAGEQRLRVTVKNGMDTVWFVATLPPPAAFSAVSSTQVSGAYHGSTVVSVMAVDSLGDPFPSASVRFAVAAQSGKVLYPMVRTGSNGIAKTTWTFDSTVVGSQILLATIDGMTDTLEFEATVAGPPQPDTLIAGGTVTVSGVVGTSVPLTVRVLDQNQHPIANAQVTFKPLTASGTVSGSGVTKTTSAGVASTSWTFGSVAGTQRLIVTARGLTDTLRYVATVTTPPVATSIEATSDTTPTGAAGSNNIVTVVVRDGAGAPFAKASVRFRVKTGAGYIPASLVTTDKNGVARTTWTFGGRPIGTQLLTAELVGTTAAPVNFTATVSVGAPTVVVVVTGANQIGKVSTALTVSPTVRVIDNYGNVIPSVSVACAVTKGGGTVQHATATTDSLGVASCGTWTMGAAVGSNMLTAGTAGARTATFTAMAKP